MRLDPVLELQGKNADPTVLVLPDDRVLALGGSGLSIWDGSGAQLHWTRGVIAGDIEEDEEEFPGQAMPHGYANLVAAGDVALSWGGMSNVTVWPLDGGALHRVFHGDEVSDAALAADGRRAISVARDERWVWDTSTGEILHRLQHAADDHADDDDADGPAHRCTGRVAIHPDGRRAVTAGTGLCVWDLATGAHLRTLFDGRVGALWFRSDGRLFVAAGGSGGVIASFDLDDGRCRSMEALDGTGEDPVVGLIGEPASGVSRQGRAWRAAGVASPPADPDDVSLLFVERHGYEVRTPSGGAPYDVTRGRREIDQRRFGACLPLSTGRHVILESHWQAAPALLIADHRGRIVHELPLADRLALRAVGRSGRVIAGAGAALRVIQLVDEPT
ncbi:MAG: hypothetical protein K8W52_08200 [Deltaproteobacteria bacterium]|nr:hypothetical protein [Deltaproteobacteria bacterium]